MSYKNFFKSIEEDPIPILFAFSILGVVIAVLHIGFITEAITALMWSLACLMGGTLLGLIFGIPKTSRISKISKKGKNRNFNEDLKGHGSPLFEGNEPTHQTNTDIQANTNLEEVSDWLAKIIIGVSLVEIREIGSSLRTLAEDLGAALNQGGTALNQGGAPDHVMFALALIIYFSALGFLFGYLYTRLNLSPALSRADIATKMIGIGEQIKENTETTSKVLETASKVLPGILCARGIIAQFDIKHESLSDFEKSDLLRQAEKEINNVLVIAKYHPESLKLKAKIYRRRAELNQKQQDNIAANSNWQKAIAILSECIKNNDPSECRDAYYNRACYKKLNNWPKTEILSDLKEAFSIDPAIKEYANHDPDLASLQSDEDYLKLL